MCAHEAVAADHLAGLLLRAGPEHEAAAPLLGEDGGQPPVADGGLHAHQHVATLVPAVGWGIERYPVSIKLTIYRFMHRLAPVFSLNRINSGDGNL